MSVDLQKVMSGFDSLLNSINGGTQSTISTTQDQIQHNLGDLTIILGYGSLRLMVVDNDKSASIAFTPVDIEVGTFKLNKSLQLALYSTEYRETRESMFMGGGELFQLSTLYDFDFGIVKDIVPKYLELLKALKDSGEWKKIHIETYEAALATITDLVVRYEEE